MKIIIKVKGGPHSGNFGHAGIPGQGSQYDDYSVIYAEMLPYGEE